MLRAGLFDMDGTMFDTEKLSMEGWLYASRQTGIPITREQILAFRGGSVAVNYKRFQSWYGEDAPYFELRKCRTWYQRHYIEEHGLEEKEGLRDILDYLKKDLGWKLCIATGTYRSDAEHYWNKNGTLDYFDGTVCGDEVPNCKPQPEIYLKAAEIAGVPPQECMVFEDAPNGILAAHAAGCHSILVADLDEPDPEISKKADYVCHSLTEALAYLKEIQRQ